MRVTSEDGLHSHLPPEAEFDSSVESAFARKFGESPRKKWTIAREGVILHQRQTTFVPDFVFRHADGTEVAMEIVGFWTPEYLDKKRATIRTFARHKILLAVPQKSLGSARLARASERNDLIPYKNQIEIGEVLKRLEGMRNA
jgi:predicted nuclease of restriction endonuclease-like RecB superfamily